IPPMKRAKRPRSRSAAASTSSSTMSGTVATISKPSAVARAPAPAPPPARARDAPTDEARHGAAVPEALRGAPPTRASRPLRQGRAVVRVTVRGVVGGDPAVRDLAGEGDVPRALGGQQDGEVGTKRSHHREEGTAQSGAPRQGE